MTSIARQILRSNPNYEKPVRPQYTEWNEDGSYLTLHPTKGWKHVSAQRNRIRQTMMNKFGFIR